MNAVKKMEKGEYNVSINNLRKLYQEYSISSDYLLYGKGETAEDIWIALQNTEDCNKIDILLRLIYYFTKLNQRHYIDKAENDEIFQVIQRLMEQK